MSAHQIPSEAVNKLPCINEFLDSIPSARTAQTYSYMLGAWSIFLSGAKHVKPNDASTWTDDLMARFHEWLIRKKYQMSTVANGLAALKRYLTWMDAHDLLSFRLDKAVNRWQVARGGRNYGSRARVRHADPDVPRIVTYYDSLDLPAGDTPKGRTKRLELLRARAIVHTLYASAGRASEICSITREMLRDGHLSECTITGKGGKDRPLMLTREAQKAIVAYCAERKDNYPGLFIAHGRSVGRPLERGTIWAIVKQAAKELDIKGFASPHAFRHYRAQQLLDEGMSLEALQTYLGHSDINMTRRVYAPNTSLAKIRRQLEQFGISAETAAQKISTS